MSPSKARGLNAAFWGSLAAGRGLAIPLATRASPQAMLLADCVGCIFAMLLLCLAPRCAGAECEDAAGQPTAWAATIFFGFSMASVFPTMLTYAERVMPVTGCAAQRKLRTS